MIYELDGNEYDVVINKKNNKNLYIRVKENKIYVTCNYLTTTRSIKKILDENRNALRKMVIHDKKEREKLNGFFYLGKSYDIIYDESIKEVNVIGDSIYAKNEKQLNKWYKEETIRIFDERYVHIFNHFNENVKSPILKIRNMKTRWGVYNRSNHTITLNSRLIELDIEKIDYVIVHELSHIIYFDHSKDFWNLVEKYCSNYKSIRKEMRE